MVANINNSRHLLNNTLWHCFSVHVNYTGSPTVNSLHPCSDNTCIVPTTLLEDVTFECTVDSSAIYAPIWEVNRSNSTGQIFPDSNVSNAYRNQGYIVENPPQNNYFSMLNVTQTARQKHAQITVRCIEYTAPKTDFSDYYYIVTYGK